MCFYLSHRGGGGSEAGVKNVTLFFLKSSLLLEIKIKNDLNKRTVHSVVSIFSFWRQQKHLFIVMISLKINNQGVYPLSPPTVWTRWCSHSWWSVYTIPRISTPGPDPARESECPAAELWPRPLRQTPKKTCWPRSQMQSDNTCATPGGRYSVLDGKGKRLLTFNSQY